jgi:methanobactin biosynthesis MbnP-like protein
MKKNIFGITVLVASIFTVLVFSCKKPAPAVNTSQITVGFHFHSWIGGVALSPALYAYEPYPDSLGRTLTLTTAQFYISNIAIHTTTGGWQQPQPGLIMLKRIDNEAYTLGNINPGLIDTVKYTIGVGNPLNTQAPTAFSTSSATDSVLSSTEAALMFGSAMPGMTGMASGYTFMNIQGRDSTDHLSLNYQLGGYGDTVNIVLIYPGGFSFSPVLPGGEINYIHQAIDYGTLLQVFNPLNSGNTNSQFWGTNPSPANSLLNALKLNSINNIIHWECSPPINC